MSAVLKKRGGPWTEEEHIRFLLGVHTYGKGDWRSIARNYVQTRSPSQIASHAQKFFLHQAAKANKNSEKKQKPLRLSFLDITTANLYLHKGGNLTAERRAAPSNDIANKFELAALNLHGIPNFAVPPKNGGSVPMLPLPTPNNAGPAAPGWVKGRASPTNIEVAAAERRMFGPDGNSRATATTSLTLPLPQPRRNGAPPSAAATAASGRFPVDPTPVTRPSTGSAAAPNGAGRTAAAPLASPETSLSAMPSNGAHLAKPPMNMGSMWSEPLFDGPFFAAAPGDAALKQPMHWGVAQVAEPVYTPMSGYQRYQGGDHYSYGAMPGAMPTSYNQARMPDPAANGKPFGQQMAQLPIPTHRPHSVSPAHGDDSHAFRV